MTLAAAGNNNMNDAANWPGIAFITGVLNAVMGLTFENWMAMIGVLGMIASIVMQYKQWSRRANQETELHQAKMKNHEQPSTNNDGE